MILLEPANKITHLNVEIKRRTISLTGLAETSGELADNQGGLNRSMQHYLIS